MSHAALIFVVLAVVIGAFVPPDGASVSGIVVDPEGRPVAGATVSLIGDANHHWPGRTNEEGKFLINVPQPGRYTVVAEKRADGYAFTISLFHHLGIALELPEVSVFGQESIEGVVVRLGPRQSRIVACVRDGLTGRAIAEVTFKLTRGDRPEIELIGARPLPDRAGCFELLVPPAVPVTVEASAPGYARSDLTGAAVAKDAAPIVLGFGEVREVQLDLSPER